MNIKILLITIFFATALFCQSCRSVPEMLDASKNGNKDEINKLLKEDPFLVNCQDKWGLTPLMYASAYCQVDVVKLLVKSGANIEQRDRKGVTVLQWTQGSINNCKKLDERIVDLQRQKYQQANIDRYREVHSPENQRKWEEILKILIEASEKKEKNK